MLTNTPRRQQNTKQIHDTEKCSKMVRENITEDRG